MGAVPKPEQSFLPGQELLKAGKFTCTRGYAFQSYLGTVIPAGPKSLESFGGQEKRPGDLLSLCSWGTVGMSCTLSWFLVPLEPGIHRISRVGRDSPPDSLGTCTAS